MGFIKCRFLACLVMVVLFSQPSVADKIFIPIASGVGVPEKDLYAVSELAKAAVAESDDHQLANSADKADYTLNFKVLRLGDAAVLTVTRDEGGQSVFSTKLKAESIEDSDTVVARLVRAGIRQEVAGENAEVDSVTKEEQTRIARRMEAVNQWMFGFGPAWVYGLNYEQAPIIWKFGYNFGIDYQFDVKLQFDTLTFPDADDASFTNTSIGANYYFTKARTSFYVLGDFGYGRAAAHTDRDEDLFDWDSDDVASGFTLGLGGGVKFFRTSKVNLGIELRHVFMFDKTEESEKVPGQTSLSLAVYW